MPILYVHGVNTRSRGSFEDGIQKYLRRYLAPIISQDRPESVLIDQAYWGDLGLKLAFGGVSRPFSQLLGMGGNSSSSIESLNPVIVANQLPHQDLKQKFESRVGSSSGLISGASEALAAKAISLGAMPPDQLSDAMTDLVEIMIEDPDERTRLSIISDEISLDNKFRETLRNSTVPTQPFQLLEELQRRSSEETNDLIAQGGGLRDWFAKAADRLGELVDRAASTPTYAASVVLAELRKPLNALISLFVGDVFVYLDRRLSTDSGNVQTRRVAGEVPNVLLNKLLEAQKNKQQRGGEPLVVLSHSMGGQLVYDAVTTFMPEEPHYKDIQIDFWCATASQVGFFEEAKLFLASKPEYENQIRVPYPSSHLGYWWNVWDPNDVLSFTTRGIFQDVDDEPYSSGMSLLNAHGGYLVRPSFYRKLAQKLDVAKRQNWRMK